MRKLIPKEDRNKYRCACCLSKPVKYLIPTYNPMEGECEYELPYCNKCALLTTQKEVIDAKIFSSKIKFINTDIARRIK